MLPSKHSSTAMVGEARAHVQGESLKARAALHVRLINSPITRAEGIIMRAILIVWAVLLTGCVSPAERAAQMRAQWAAIDAADNSRCLSYGTQRGTPAYAQCRMQIAQMRQQAIEADQTRRAALAGAILANQRPYQPIPITPYQAPTNQGTNCTTSYIGSQAYTHCQ